MALHCGIVGIAYSGKTTLFNSLSSSKASSEENISHSGRPNICVVNVPDDRLYELVKYQPTEKIVHATVEIIDIPGLTKSGGKGEQNTNSLLSEIRNADALIHVLRCFDNDNVPSADGIVDPVRDIEIVELELQIRDLQSVEKKISYFEKTAYSGNKEASHALEILKIYKQHIESLKPARTAPVDANGRKITEDLCLLSAKPVVYICNVDEKSAATGNEYSEKVREYLGKESGNEVIVVAAKLEAEIAELENSADRKDFLEQAGLEEPGLNKLIRAAYHLLNLRTFFTIGPKEVRAWTIHAGMNARQAAGVIHSDMEKGFIRTEVIKYHDFLELKSETLCKEKGKLALEGKNYIVEDGDLMHIRFNV